MNAEGAGDPLARIPRGFAVATAATGALSVSIGALVLLGWILDVGVLKSVFPGLVAMKPNTAVGLMTGGASLWLLGSGAAGPLRRRAGRGMAGVATLIGLLTLSEYLVGWNLGIDELLFNEPAGAISTTSPGRMAIATAATFVLIGSALLCLDVRTRGGKRPSQVLALLATPPATIALLGYLYGARPLYGAAPWFAAIAVHTAVALLALSIGVLLARPSRALVALVRGERPGSAMVRRLGPALILAPPVVGWLCLRGQMAGYYPIEVAIALSTAVNIPVFSVLLLLAARSLNRAEDARGRAEEVTRTRANEARENERFLDSIVENIPNMIFVKDADALRFVRFNRAGEQLLGHSREDLLGKSDHDFFPREEAEAFTAKDREVLDGHVAVDISAEPVETRLQGRRILHTKKIPILDGNGHARYLLGISEDITDRQRVEHDLRIAKEDADQANRAKSEYLSRMSHELRTPLNAILGFGQLLEMDEPTGEQGESVAQILKAGRHLLDLINEILDIARIEAGRMSLSLEPVLIDEALTDAIALVAPLATARGIEVVLEGASDGRHVRADRQRLRQVLLNLLSNAVKYNRTGGTVTVSCADASNGCHTIEIADTGEGLRPEEIERLFTPFDRLGAASGGVEGTGLGLALSKGLVEAMGGTIAVASRPGEGSMFSIELPTAQGQLEGLADAGGTASPGPVEQRGTVLYVEDNASNLKLVERVLERRPGIRLIAAMQGRLGVELAAEHRPDVILLDVHLPDIPGDEALRRLRANPDTRHIPVVVVSADATPGRVKELLAAGAMAYVTKPLDVEHFLAVLDQALSRPVTVEP